MTDTPRAGYGLLISFPDQSDSFVHGWEAGVIYQRMQVELGPIEATIHTANKEVVTRCCGSLGWQVEFTETDFSEWTNAVLTRAGKPKLSVVG